MTRHSVQSYMLDVEKCVHYILQHPHTPLHASRMLRNHVSTLGAWPDLESIGNTATIKLAYEKLDYTLQLCRGIFSAHLSKKSAGLEEYTQAYLRLIDKHAEFSRR